MEEKVIDREDEKCFSNLYLYSDAAKDDLASFMKEKKFKYQFDFASLIIVIAMLALISTSMVLRQFWLLLILIPMIVGLILARKQCIRLRQMQFVEYYQSLIIESEKAHPGCNVISPIYPIEVHVNNENETIVIRYHDEDYINCDFQDIKECKILADTIEVDGDLSIHYHKHKKSYVFSILFNNKKKADIVFSSNNKKQLNQYVKITNMKSVNKLAAIFNTIIKEGNV